MNDLFKNLFDRMAERGQDAKFPGAVALVKSAALAHGEICATRDSVRGDKNLTATGQHTRIIEYLEKAAAALQKHGRMIEKARTDIDARHAGLKPKFSKVDPAILIAVAGKIAAMKPAEQAALLLVERGVDPIHAQAVLDLPPILSGVDNLVRDTLERSLIGKMHGPALAAMEDEREAWNTAEAALRAAMNALQEAGDFPSPHAFELWFAKVAPSDSNTAAVEKREFDNFAAEAILIAAKGLSHDARMKLNDDILNFTTSEITGKPWPPVAA